MKFYPCEKSDSGQCKYGGNKYYNYGFVQGMSPYCRKIRKWIGDIAKCPLSKEEKETSYGLWFKIEKFSK